MSWITESNRMKYFLYAIPCAFLLGIAFVLGLALGMVFKDYKYGNKFDILDFWTIMLGGAIGQGLNLIIYFIL